MFENLLHQFELSAPLNQPPHLKAHCFLPMLSRARPRGGHCPGSAWRLTGASKQFTWRRGLSARRSARPGHTAVSDSAVGGRPGSAGSGDRSHWDGAEWCFCPLGAIGQEGVPPVPACPAGSVVCRLGGLSFFPRLRINSCSVLAGGATAASFHSREPRCVASSPGICYKSHGQSGRRGHRAEQDVHAVVHPGWPSGQLAALLGWNWSRTACLGEPSVVTGGSRPTGCSSSKHPVDTGSTHVTETEAVASFTFTWLPHRPAHVAPGAGPSWAGVPHTRPAVGSGFVEQTYPES